MLVDVSSLLYSAQQGSVERVSYETVVICSVASGVMRCEPAVADIHAVLDAR